MMQTLARREPQVASHAGPRLTIVQRAILLRLVAQYHAVARVRVQLAADHPDFPPISDDLIRYYRRQLNADTMRAAQVLRVLALQTGLAQKAVRVAHLIRMAEQWLKVPLVEQRTTMDERGEPQIAYVVRPDASRELRAILKQIALELGQLGYAEPALVLGGDMSADGNDTDDAIRADLEQLLRQAAQSAVDTRA